MVEELRRPVQQATAVFVFTLHKVSVADVEALRRSLRALSARAMVVKHSLGRRVLAERGVEALETSLAGTSGVSVTEADPVAVSKLLVAFAKEHEGFAVRGALVEGRVLAVEEIQALSALPSRDVLLAALLRSCQAPLRGLVVVLSGVTRQFVRVVDAIRQSKEGGPSA